MRIGNIEIRKDTKSIHNYIYVFLLLGIVVCMPLSKWITSLFQFLLIIHWLLRGDYREKLIRIKTRPSIWILSLFLLIPLVGMIYTSNLEYGLHDLKIKIPLLALPLVIGSSETITGKQLKVLLLSFVASVSISSLVSLGIISGIIPYNYSDVREASLFISHIRLALLVDMSIFILTYYALRQEANGREKIALFIWASYFLVFLVSVKALTGIVVGIFVGTILCIRWLLRNRNKMVRKLSMIVIVLVPIFVGSYITYQVKDFYDIKESRENLDKSTTEGNPYWHDLENLHLENGYYTGLYICEKEMREVWNMRSSLDYDGKDYKGQELRYTIIRYITSMGLRKDAEGISGLAEDDISLIESGYANNIYKNKKRFKVRMYELIWQIDVYKKGGNPSGHSVTQRIEYLRTGLAILLDHPWTGVGTGDVPDAFEQKYIQTNSMLDEEWRLRAHNQWLTFAITFGLPLSIILLISFFLPGFINKKYGQYFFLLFLMVSFLSMFNEDTLETQAGVAFFAFFYPFLLFAPKLKD